MNLDLGSVYFARSVHLRRTPETVYLIRTVEVMLQGSGGERFLAATNKDEATVPQIGRIHFTPFELNDARGACAWK